MRAAGVLAPLVLLVMGGCTELSVVAPPVAGTCTKPVISRIVISVSTDAMVVVEPHKYENLRSSMRDLVFDNAVHKLYHDFIDDGLNVSIVKGGSCEGADIFVEANAVSFEQRNGRYMGTVLVRMTECGTRRVMKAGELYARNQSFLDTPKELGRDLGRFVHTTLNECR
jgi:hypothetical protein